MTLTYETDRLILKTLSEEEAPLTLAYYSHNKTFLMPYEPVREDNFYTLSHQGLLLGTEQKEMDGLRLLRFWLFLKSGATDRPIGSFAFSNIVRGAFLNANLGYKGDKDHLRQGYMREALEKGIRILFDDYGLHRIEANIMPRNIPSLNLVRKLGFREEGLAKDYLRINGKWEDHIHMVLLNKDL